MRIMEKQSVLRPIVLRLREAAESEHEPAITLQYLRNWAIGPCKVLICFLF
jgi:hypothetical protein